MIYKKTPKYKTFRFVWDGQINFTVKGLKYILDKFYKNYLKELKIEEIKTEE